MSHVRWEDLLAEEEQEAATGRPGAETAPGAGSAGGVPEGLPELELRGPSLEQVAATDPELAALLQERKSLEGKMSALLGVEEAPVDERLAKQFPVVEHTPETRIAERRQHERDTARRLLEQKLYARKRSEEEEAGRVEELRRRRIQAGRAKRRQEEREEEQRQEQARKAQERVRLAARLAEQLMEARAGTGAQPRPIRAAVQRLVLGGVEKARAVPGRLLEQARSGQGLGRLVLARPKEALVERVRQGLPGLGLGSPGSMDVDELAAKGMEMGGMDMEEMEMAMERDRGGMNE